MGDKKEDVKQWYDGFTFGGHRDIYNPWSITNYLKEKKFRPYWASTSSNGIVGKLIRKASVNLKEKMEDVDYRGITLEPWYKLNITNLETVSMFLNMFKGWFESSDANYNDFIKALLRGNLKEMNIYMNDVALATFSSFDTGRQPSHRSQPERFYHGFVLGLLVELRERYEVKSNRESVYGRYDVMLVPRSLTDDAVILQFKVHEPDEEKTLEDTVHAALKQIREKNYDAELLNRGIKKENIRHYGFAFEGKKVLIGGD